jgi:hypothetical protein
LALFQLPVSFFFGPFAPYTSAQGRSREDCQSLANFLTFYTSLSVRFIITLKGKLAMMKQDFEGSDAPK